MQIRLDQYDSELNMDIACLFTKQKEKYIKTKLVSRRVAITIIHSTCYTLHLVQMLDPSLNLSNF